MNSKQRFTARKLGSFTVSQIAFVAGFALLGLLAGVFLSNRGEPTTAATTPILVNPLEGNPFRPSNRGEDLVNLETEAQAVRSSEVVQVVRENTGTGVPERDLIDAVSVEVPVNTQILEITYTDTDPDVAVGMSQAFAEAYLSVRATRARSRTDEQVAQIEEQIADLNSQLLAATGERAETDPDSLEASLLEQQIDSLAAQINTLEGRIGELTGIPVDPGQVVTAAEIQSAGPLSNPLVLPLAGLFGGLAAGVVIVLVRAQAADRATEPADLAASGLSVIGTVGWWEGTRSDAPMDPKATVHDEVRRICVTLLSMEKRRPLSLLAAPAGSNRYHSALVTEMATAFTKGGFRTLVIDPVGELRVDHDHAEDQETPGGHRPGLSDVILGDVPLTDALQTVGPRLQLLGPGTDIERASELFLGSSTSQAVRGAMGHCDVLIVTSDSAQGATTQALASAVDAAILEVEPDTLKRRELSDLRKSLELLDTSLLGAVFVGDRGSAMSRQFAAEAHRRALPPAPLALYGPIEDPHGVQPPSPAPSPATEGYDVPDGAARSDHPAGEPFPRPHQDARPDPGHTGSRAF